MASRWEDMLFLHQSKNTPIIQQGGIISSSRYSNNRYTWMALCKEVAYILTKSGHFEKLRYYDACFSSGGVCVVEQKVIPATRWFANKMGTVLPRLLPHLKSGPTDQFEEEMAQNNTVTTITKARLQQLVEETHHGKNEHSTYQTQKLEQSPMMHAILDEIPSANFTTPAFNKYDNVPGDPYIHVKEFENKLWLYTAN